MRFNLVSVCFSLCFCAVALAAPTAPPIRTRSQWGALTADRVIRGNNPIEFTIHHTATAASSWTGDASLVSIQRDQMDPPRNFDDIGYHYIIGVDGTIFQGREDDVVPEHVKSNHRNKLAICLIGHFHGVDPAPTAEQLESLKQLMAYKGCTLGIDPGTHTYGHTQRASAKPTDCPGRDFLPMIPGIATEARNRIAASPTGCSSNLNIVDCTSPAPLDAALGTCTDGTNTGNCVASAAGCADGVVRAAGDCSFCCFNSRCGCHEDANDPSLRGSPSLGDCTSRSGTRGVCIQADPDPAGNSTVGTCPSGDIVPNRCPNDPDEVRCCVNKAPTCVNAAAVAGAVAGLGGIAGITAYGVTRVYKPQSSGAGGTDVSEKRTRGVSSKSRSDSTAPLAIRPDASSARPEQNRRSSTASKASKSSKSSKNSKSSKTSKSSKGSKAKKSRTKSTGSRSSVSKTRSTSTGSRSSVSKTRSTSTGSRGSRGSGGKTRSTSTGSRGSGGKRRTSSSGGK